MLHNALESIASRCVSSLLLYVNMCPEFVCAALHRSSTVFLDFIVPRRHMSVVCCVLDTQQDSNIMYITFRIPVF